MHKKIVFKTTENEINLRATSTALSFQIDTKLKGFELHYAGAPFELMYEDTSNLDGLLNEQYILFDLAAPKHIGGVRTQGRNLITFKDCVIVKERGGVFSQK